MQKNNTNNQANITQNEKILQLFYNAIKNHQIFEKTTIKHFKDGKRILQKNTKKIPLNTKKIITKFLLPENKNLLILDYPLNQYLSHSIYLNPNTELYEYELKTEPNTKYISTKTTKNILQKKEKIKPNTIKKIQTKTLINQPFTQTYKSPNQIKKIKEYIQNTKNINPNQINKNNKINELQNLTPTLKNTHFNIAKNLQIPIIPQIKNEFIEPENINIFDINKIIEQIKPLEIIEEKILVPVEKTTLKRTYLDVSTTYHLKINTEQLIEKINQTQITSEPKKKIIKTIQNIKQTEISQNYGTLKIPIWKIHENQNYIEIKNFTHFKEITGINYPKKQTELNQIYIQDKFGEIGTLKNQYLKKRFQNTLENLPENEILVYEKPLDLAIKSILTNHIQLLIKHQKTSPKQIEKLNQYIEKLIEITILKTIEHNKIPEKILPTTPTQNYFESIAYKLNNQFEKFLKKPKKTNLIHSTNNDLKTLQKYLTQIKNKKINLQQNDLFFLCQIIKQTLQILDIFDQKNFQNNLNRFQQYFKINNYELDITKTKKQLNQISNTYKTVKQTYLANKLTQKTKTKNKIQILQKPTQNPYQTLLNQNIKTTATEPEFKLQLNPNYNKIIKLFPYKYTNIATQIKQTKIGTQNPTLNLGTKPIPLKKEYCKITKIYTNYKTICENNYFTILKEK